MARYIDADDYRKKWADVFDSAYGDSCCRMFKKSIDEQPTADVRENVHGEWVVDKYNAEFCSVCGKHPYNDGEYYVAGWDSDFCPHCGADMRSTSTASDTKGGWDGEYYLEDC